MPVPENMRYRFRGSIAPGSTPRAALLDGAVEAGVAKLRLYDPIDSWGGEWGVSAKEFTSTLDALDGDVTEIHLHINSPGGEVYEGIAILNALRNHPARTVAVVDGLAASAASFIATGADELIMGKNSQLMIHDAWGIAIGAAVDMRDMGDRLDKISDNIASVYAEKAGGTVAGWRAAMLAETWYSAEESVLAGLADSVEGDEPAEDVEPQNAFDLTVFTYPGREAAPDPVAARVDDSTDADRKAHQERRHRMNARKAR